MLYMLPFAKVFDTSRYICNVIVICGAFLRKRENNKIKKRRIYYVGRCCKILRPRLDILASTLSLLLLYDGDRVRYPSLEKESALVYGRQ